MKRTPLRRKSPMKAGAPGRAGKATKPMRAKVSKPSAGQLEFREAVRALGCPWCKQPAEIHHPVGRTGKHQGQPVGHWWLLPLCERHHRHPNVGIHSHPMRKTVEKATYRLVLQALIQGDYRGAMPPPSVVDAIEDYHR